MKKWKEERQRRQRGFKSEGLQVGGPEGRGSEEKLKCP